MSPIKLALIVLSFIQGPWFLVEQDVDTITVAHIDDGVTLIFFWDKIQGDWSLIDHRWYDASMMLHYDQGMEKWVLFWRDDSDSCYRVIRCNSWIESWEKESPLAVQANRPWFARLLAPGLKKP